MGRWSSAAISRRQAIKEYRIEEAADALLNVLKRQEDVIKRPDAIPLVVFEVEKLRKKEGHQYIPCIENRPVPAPNDKFIDNNWSGICTFLASTGDYVCWDVGKYGGVYLGTLEEYHLCLGKRADIIAGAVDAHNTSAHIIRKKGRDAHDLSLQEEADEILEASIES